jgi:hypothetical protein
METVDLKMCYQIDSDTLKRLEVLKEDYRLLYDSPDSCAPKIIINVKSDDDITWEQQLNDPLAMLKTQLDAIDMHLRVGDDFLPAVRVNFGTGIIASAFGCDLVTPPNNLPAVSTHALSSIQEVNELKIPSLDCEMYRRIENWTDIWRNNLPEGVAIQHPDIQGPFNSAHLIRGNDILTDFYDDPDALCRLLNIVTDHTVEALNFFNTINNQQNGWFHDWGGAYWKGNGRISNCSVDMISPEFYLKYVLPRDMRLLDSIGGGRIHYCGGNGDVIDEFLCNPAVTGLDIDASLHDLWDIADRAPEKMVLVFQSYGKEFDQIDRLLSGDWPKKRNIILYTNVQSEEEGRELLVRLRESVPY